MISCSFHPEASAELEEASVFYESRVAGLGKSLASEVERTVLLIRQFPDAGSLVGRSRRRVLVPRFPDSIVILAVAHQRRRPGYWRQRK